MRSRRRQDQGGGGLDQADNQTAGKGAEHAAETAQRHGDVSDQRKGRADIRVDIEEDRHDRAGEPDQRGAEAPTERKHLVLVDTD